MQTEQSTAPHGRRMMMFCLMDSDGRTKAHPKIPQKSACYSRHLRCQGLRPLDLAVFKCNPRFFEPHVGIRAPDADNQCLPVFRFETGKASAISAFLKLSIRFGEIFAAFKRAVRKREPRTQSINQELLRQRKRPPNRNRSGSLYETLDKFIEPFPAIVVKF